ncbi:MAG: AMP-binding protein, partial [Actinobacteria bacterium]|nr:AMP-binding protein [Actinomycetota bacterium]
MGELIHHLLERNSRKYPDDLAARYPSGDVSLTWREANGRANALAHYLREKGINRGDRVAFLVPNRPEFFVAYFAVLKAGAVVVPINVRLAPPEISYILADSGASGLVYDEALSGVAEEAAKDVNPALILSTRELAGTFSRCSREDLNLPGNLSGLAEIIYTSGTTGRPKGVMLTHNSVYLVASMVTYETDVRWRDRVLHLMPFTHSAPLNLFMVGATYVGAANIMADFAPQALLELTQAERTTHFFGAPVAYLLAARMPNFSQYDLSSTRCWTYGGAPMSREAVLFATSKFPGRFMSLYGLTEAGPNGIALYPEEHPEFAGSIGRRGVVNSEFRVVDEQGKEVQPGEVGEIILRTASAMEGYYRNEEATREMIRDGWIWTGDIAHKDERGYLWVMDRKKDVVISGGVNVYPKEVEDILNAH